MPWLAPTLDGASMWAPPGGKLEHNLRAQGWVEVSGPQGPGLPPPDPSLGSLVRSVNGIQADAEGALALTAGDVGALSDTYEPQLAGLDATLAAKADLVGGSVPEGQMPSLSHLYVPWVDVDSGTGIPSEGRVETLEQANTAVGGRLDTLETAVLRAQDNDLERYGDLVSSERRVRATAWEEYSSGFMTFSGVIAPRAFTATKVRFFLNAAAVAGAAPSQFLALYSGTNRAALEQRANITAADLYTAAELREITLPASFAVAKGDYVYLLFGCIDYTTSPRLQVTVGTPPALINPGIAFDAYATNPGSAPATLDASAGTWTKTNTVPWWALL